MTEWNLDLATALKTKAVLINSAVCSEDRNAPICKIHYAKSSDTYAVGFVGTTFTAWNLNKTTALSLRKELIKNKICKDPNDEHSLKDVVELKNTIDTINNSDDSSGKNFFDEQRKSNENNFISNQQMQNNPVMNAK